MKEQEFIDKIFAQKKKAHDLMEGDGGYRISRGMAHSISGYAEDLFSVYMAKKIKREDFRYYVDKVISLKLAKDANAKSFKPDLMVLDNANIVTHYFDLKTDLGWNRRLDDYLAEKNKFIDSIKGKDAWIYYPDDKTINVKISRHIKYQMVVLFGWNINQEILKNNIHIASKLKNVEVYVLYAKDKEGEPFAINKNEFERLVADSLKRNSPQ